VDEPIAELKRKQEQLGMGQNAFARYLGISTAHLSDIYAGKAPLRVNKTVAAILRRFPEMACIFLPESVAEATGLSVEQQA